MVTIAFINIILLSKRQLRQMLFSFGLQIQILWNIRYHVGDETCDEVHKELEHKHESEAGSYHVPVMLVLFIGWIRCKIAIIPKTYK